MKYGKGSYEIHSWEDGWENPRRLVLDGGVCLSRIMFCKKVYLRGRFHIGHLELSNLTARGEHPLRFRDKVLILTKIWTSEIKWSYIVVFFE